MSWQGSEKLEQNLKDYSEICHLRKHYPDITGVMKGQVVKRIYHSVRVRGTLLWLRDISGPGFGSFAKSKRSCMHVDEDTVGKQARNDIT